MSPRRKTSRERPATNKKSQESTTLRIIGGRFRGRRLIYSGDRRTRPMKDRVREATFDLIGPSIRDRHAIDLFAGTGALGLEAVSRGATQVTLIERHFPTARIIEQNIALLSVINIAEVIAADVFVWARRQPDLGTLPSIVFCSPPYCFYEERLDDMVRLIGTFLDRTPDSSILVVEADERLDTGQLPQPQAWDVRSYPPAIIAVYRSDHAL